MTKLVFGLNKRYRVNGSYIWYIDKRVKRYGRLCESTGTSDREEAERYLLHRLHELREVLAYGERPTRTCKEAAQKYLLENRTKKSVARDAGTLKDMEPFIGHLPLNRINSDTFAPTEEQAETFPSERAIKKSHLPGESYNWQPLYGVLQVPT